MTITNLTLLRKNLFNTIDQVIDYNDPVTINTKKGNAVIISEEDYNALCETIMLLTQPEVVKKIDAGKKEKLEDMTTYNPDEEW